MELFYSTKWSDISHTQWRQWFGAAWKDLGFVLNELGAVDETQWPSILRALPKEKKQSVIRIKLMFEGYDDVEIEKKVNKTSKVTVKDIEFIKKKIEINNINL